MAPHSSTLAWKILWTEEPGGLQSVGSLRVGHDWATSLSPFTFMHWRRKWQPTPVFLPGESQGRGSLVGCHLWGHIESDISWKEVDKSIHKFDASSSRVFEYLTIKSRIPLEGTTWKIFCSERVNGFSQFSSVQSLSLVRLFATPWITAPTQRWVIC